MPKAKKKASSKPGTRVNKSAWIRSQPQSLNARAVVDKAKAEGIHLSLAQVYTARSTAKNRSGEAGTSAQRRGRGRPKASASQGVSGDLRRQFVQLAVRIGTDEAQRLLTRIVDAENG